eukprot:gene3662-6477_t
MYSAGIEREEIMYKTGFTELDLELPTPQIYEEKPKYVLKGDSFKNFSKLFSKPSDIDKTSTIRIETRKNEKKKYNQIILGYDIDAPVEKQNEIEHKMVALCSIKHENILQHEKVYVKKPIKNSSYSYHISTTDQKLKRTLETDIFETIQGKNNSFPPNMIEKWFFEIISGLDALHGQGITHNNLLPSSIFLDTDNHVQLSKIGFGFEENIESLTQNEAYFAPEIFDDEKFTTSSDVYSLGVLMMKLIYLENVDLEDVDELIGSIPKEYKKMEIIDVITKCLSDKPNSRPTISEMLKLKRDDNIELEIEKISIDEETPSKVLRRERMASISSSFDDRDYEDEDDELEYVSDDKNLRRSEILIEKDEEEDEEENDKSKISQRAVRIDSNKLDLGLMKSKSSSKPPPPMKNKKEIQKPFGRRSSSSVEGRKGGKNIFSPKSMKKKSKESYLRTEEEEVENVSSGSDSFFELQKPPNVQSSSVISAPPPPPGVPIQYGGVIPSGGGPPPPNYPSRTMEKKKDVKLDDMMTGDLLKSVNKEIEQQTEQLMMLEDQLESVDNEIMLETETIILEAKSDEPQKLDTESTKLRQSEISRLLETIENEGVANKDFAIAGLLDYVEKDVFSSIKYDSDKSVSSSVEIWSKIVSSLQVHYVHSMSDATRNQYDNLCSVLKKMRDAEKIADIESLMSSSSYSSYSTGEYPFSREMNLDELNMATTEMYSMAKKKSAGFSFNFSSCFSIKPKEKSAAQLLAEELKSGLTKKDSFKTDKNIGSGCSANVYLVSSKDFPDQQYVLKIFKDGSEEDARQEISVYEKLQNENIVKYFEYFKYDDGYGAVQTAIKLEYCNKGDLSKLCKNKKRKKVESLTQKEILNILIQIITGLIYLHAQKFVHCDLKPGNVFLTDDKVKIADFGFAVSFGSRLMGGSLEYMSPEQFENHLGFVAHPSIDIWSFGCLVLELLTKKKHDLKISINKNSNYVDEVWHKEGLNDNFSTTLRDLIIRCTRMDPIERPTSKQIYLSMLAINEQKL